MPRTWAAFARRCIERELRRLESLGGAAAEGTLDAETVHKLRTTTRRLRVSLDLFAEVLPSARTAVDKELRRLGRRLGRLRDLDVCRAGLAESTGARGAGAGIASYHEHLRVQRHKARHGLEPVVNGARVQELFWRARGLLAHRHESATGDSASLHERARQHVHAAAKRLLRRGRKIGAHSQPEDLHRLRIHGKRFRYELELLSEVFPQSLPAAAHAARTLQDFLGEHQDACTARERLRRYARGQDASRAAGDLPALLRAQQRRARAVRARFPRQWRRFEKVIARDWQELLTDG